jgi:hypothetical protein
MSIPLAYKYESTIPTAVKSSSNVTRIQPINGSTFTSNNNNVIRIEIRSDSFLSNECYLKFAIENNTSNMVFLDGYATAVFNRVRLLSNGTVLSDIQAFNALSNMIIKSQSSVEYEKLLMMTGGASSTGGDALSATFAPPVFPNPAAPTAAQIATFKNANAASLAFGFNVLDRANASVPLTESKKYYSIPLGLIGFLNSSLFIPLGLIGGTGLLLELYLEPNFATAFNASAPFSANSTYTISEVEFISKQIKIQDEKTEAMIRAMWKTQGLKIKCSDWQTHFNTISANQSSWIATIPEKASCLKSVSSVMRPSNPEFNISGLQSYRYNNSGYSYKIGPTVYPEQEVSVSSSNILESLSEHLKSINSGIFNLNTNTIIRPSTWGNDNDHTQVGAYAMTYDFKAYSEEFSGIDTINSLPITLNMKFSVNTPNVINLISFCRKDVVYLIYGDGSIKKFE